MKFYINHIDDTSISNDQKVLPVLCMMLIDDGRHDYMKFHEKIQNADIKFSMIDVESGVYKVANAPAFIQKIATTGCSDEFEICYQFTKRQVNTPGIYRGYFTIDFGNDLKNDNYEYPEGVLRMPIRDYLDIIVR